MPWNSVGIDGNISVSANKPAINQNTTYIEDTMGNSPVGTNTDTTRDHFWNVGAFEDGRHRFIQSPAFTVGSVAADPVLGAGMDGVRYLKSDGLTPESIVGFYRNAQTIYQYIPAFLSGTTTLNSGGFTSIVAVPANCYGEIFLYSISPSPTSGAFSTQLGYFKAGASLCEAWSLNYQVTGTGNPSNAIKLGNSLDASGLNITARLADSAATNWGYRITYRAL